MWLGLLVRWAQFIVGIARITDTERTLFANWFEEQNLEAANK